MGILNRKGDIISTTDDKFGALTMSVPLHDFHPGGPGDPAALWASQPAIRTVTGAIAREVSGVPLHVYRRTSDTDRERDTTSPVARLLRQPAPGVGAARFFEQLVLDQAVWDRWAALIDLADDGSLRLRRLPAHRIAIAMSNGYRTGVVLFTDQGEVEIPLDRVVFDVAPSAIPGKRLDHGAPRVRTLTELADELTAAGEWRRQVLANGARVPAVIERPIDAGTWSDEAWRRFRESFAAYTRDGGRAGGTPILEDGMRLAKADVFNPRDFDTTEVRRLTLIEAAILFHYPPELLGAREGTNSNIETLREQKYVDVLGPWITNLEQALQVGLQAHMDDDAYIEANVDAKLRGAFEDRARIFQTSVGAPVMTRNEARARMNLPAIEGGDEMVTPLNVLVGGLPSPTGTREDGVGDAAPKARRAGSKADGPARRPDLPTEDAARAAFTDALTGVWHGIADQVEAYVAGQKALPDIAGAIDYDAATAALEPVIRQHMMRLAEIGAWDVLDQWNPDADGWGPEMIEAWIAAAAATNARHTATAITDGLADTARDPATFTDRLRAFLTSDAVVIALAVAFATEAFNFGGRDAAKKSGLTVKTWHVRSPNPRPSHAAQNGERVGIDDVFSNGLRWPGDTFGGAAENANCTCRLTYERGTP